MKKASNQFSTICHNIWSKRDIFIDNKSVVHFFNKKKKKKYRNNKHKKNNNKNKNTTKTKILNLWLGSPWISSLLGLRNSGVWGPAYALILSFALILPWGASASFPLPTSGWGSIEVSTRAEGAWSVVGTSDTWASCAEGEELGLESSQMSGS